MRPVTSPAPKRIATPASGEDAGASEDAWAERAGRLYADLERPARAMVRRAFRGAFSDDELDDLYAAAWVGTLRALNRRHQELSDEQIRSYLLAAVANHASKELRRRKRRPTAPLELVDAVADDGGRPEERAEGAERTRIARDLLTSLPPRRRAVMLLRYGWGLEPRQVCELVRLSPRAYRKEITRGVEELTERMRRLEDGEWCAERGSVLEAYAGGLADAEERRQAEAHLAHCRSCAEFVRGLRARLHDIGAGMALPIALESLYGGAWGASLTARLGDLVDRARGALVGLSRSAPEALGESAGGIVATGGTRGAVGAAGVPLLAKLSELGAAGKVAVACLAGGAAATACVGTGTLPALGGGASGGAERVAPRELDGAGASAGPSYAPGPTVEGTPIDAGVSPDPAHAQSAGETDASQPSDAEPSPSASPGVREFGATGSDAHSGAGGSMEDAGGGTGGDGAVDREFGTGAGGGGGSPGGGTSGGPPAYSGEFGGP